MNIVQKPQGRQALKVSFEVWAFLIIFSRAIVYHISKSYSGSFQSREFVYSIEINFALISNGVTDFLCSDR